MDNQWITLEQAAALSGKSMSMLRKLTYKNKLVSKMDNHRLTIDRQSLKAYYNLKDEAPAPGVNTGDNTTDNHGEA